MSNAAMQHGRRDVLVGAVEAGGTKFVCAIGSGPGRELLSRIEIPTTADSQNVLGKAIEWFKQEERNHGQLRALGIASFGPVDLAHASSSYGFITSTPKVGWANTDMVGPFRQAFGNVPIAFDTDVNGACLGEFHWGNARDLEDFVYVTIGTGIGAGAMARGRLLHGLVHPEMGHMQLGAIAGDSFEGICPFHGRCWEGLCSGPAMHNRTGFPAEALSAEHPAWQLEMQYIAAALSNIVFVLSPRRIIVGGSIRKAGQLGELRFFQGIRHGVRKMVNGYLASPALDEGIAEFIVPPLLGDDAGVCGAIALAQSAIDRP